MSDYDGVTWTSLGEWAEAFLILLLADGCLLLLFALFGWAELLIRWVMK